MSFLKKIHVSTHEEWCIQRPERLNALGTTVAKELADSLSELTARRKLPRALVITATPSPSQRPIWVAGGDLHELAQLKDQSQARAYAENLSGFIAGLDRLPIPVIVGIDGEAIGGGAELALSGDIRMATAQTSFSFKQLKVGLATGYGGANRLVTLAGLSRAQGILLLSKTMTAKDALTLGLIHEVVQDTQSLKNAILAQTQAWAELSFEALAAQKAMLWHSTHTLSESARQAEIEIFTKLWLNPHHASFLEGFTGREPKKT